MYLEDLIVTESERKNGVGRDLFDATVQFAKDNDLIIVTNDGKLIKQCNLLEIEFVALDLVVDLARKVLKYED